jgi:signal peptidase II
VNTLRYQAQQRLQRIGVLLLPFIGGILADQVTKAIARDTLIDLPTLHLLYGLIQLSYVENHGGFLGYLRVIPEPGRFLFLTIGVSIILCLAAIYLVRSSRLSHVQLVVSALILAGGAGNVLDRILNNGGVIDFISIGFAFFRTGIFNLADVFILSGAFFLGYSLTITSPPAKKLSA